METKEIKLKSEKGVAYYVKGITEDFDNQLKEGIYKSRVTREMTNFKEIFGLDLNSIKAHGSSKYSNFIADYIPSCIWHPFGDRTVAEKSCRCYIKKDHDIKQVRLHHDTESSWNCILQLLNNPKFCVIFTRPDVESNLTEEEVQLKLKQDQLKVNNKIEEKV